MFKSNKYNLITFQLFFYPVNDYDFFFKDEYLL